MDPLNQGQPEQKVGPTKILWLSKHPWLASQKAELERLFGPVALHHDSRPFDSAERIADRYKNGGYGELVVIASLSVVSRLCEQGLHPLWVQMSPSDEHDAEVTVGSPPRYLRFTCFRRVKAVRLELEDLE